MDRFKLTFEYEGGVGMSCYAQDGRELVALIERWGAEHLATIVTQSPSDEVKESPHEAG